MRDAYGHELSLPTNYNFGRVKKCDQRLFSGKLWHRCKLPINHEGNHRCIPSVFTCHVEWSDGDDV